MVALVDDEVGAINEKEAAVGGESIGEESCVKKQPPPRAERETGFQGWPRDTSSRIDLSHSNICGYDDSKVTDSRAAGYERAAVIHELLKMDQKF
jgi:hypothetical protein